MWSVSWDFLLKRTFIMPNVNDLTGKNAWVCGASQGIGAATALLLAQRGAQVTLIARREEALRAVQNQLQAASRAIGHPLEHPVLVLDLQDVSALPQGIAAGLDQTPTVHILVNNTGGPPPGPILEADPAAFARALQQHVLAAQYFTQALVPGMKADRYGRIINVLSTSVKIPIPQLGVSNTIRAAMANWAKTLANEVAIDGITVNNVLPGFTDTPRLQQIIQKRAAAEKVSPDVIAQRMKASVPVGRFARPEETAEAIAFLASPAAAYINGINLPVDGGRLGSL
jgi:3-oxoacyl-[acyl-carrier protein] reductase